MLPAEINTLVAPCQEPPFRGGQVFGWVQARRVSDPSAMTNLPATLRTWLADHARITHLTPVRSFDSIDGSRKLLFEVSGGTFSCVLMPTADRVTLCVSTQIGCRMGCAFCLTGQGKFARGLSGAEIVGQVIAANRLLEAEGQHVSNVVLMGMGEPLDNLASVIQAVRIITHREGLRVAPRRTTLSTVGLVPQLREFVTAQTGASIAISLCATTDAARNRVVPVGQRYPLKELFETLRSLPLPHGHRYTIEYQLIAGIGDGIEDAKRLSAAMALFPSKVNLIPFNPWSGCAYRRPSEETVETFRAFLESRHHIVTVRQSRGQDIGAACGQLDVPGL